MSILVHTGAFNIGTGAAGTTTAVTGVGFQPKAIIFWWSGRTESTNAGGSASSQRGMGFAVSSSSFCCAAIRDVDAAGTSNTDNGHRDDACILECANAHVGWADIQSMDSDGFTLEILDAFSIDFRVSFIAYGGTDITNAEIGRFTATGAAPVNQSIDNTGTFQPDITFFLSTNDADPPSVATTAFHGFGVATDSSHEYVWAARASDAASSGATHSDNKSGECIARLTGGTAVDNRAEFVSHDSDGFTINWLERASSQRIYWLSIAGGNWSLGDFLTQTDTSTTMVESSFGFTPAGVLFVSDGKAESTSDTASTTDRWSIGAAHSASARTAQAASSRDGNTLMFTQTFLRTDAIYVNTDPATDAVTALGDVQSFDSDGFTAIMDDADPAQSFVWYVAAGNVAGGGNRRRRFLLGAA
jgi:hypothetical protein